MVELRSIQWCWFDLLFMDVIKFTWGNPLNEFLGWINQPWLLNTHVWCFTCIPGRLHTQFFGFLHHWNCFPIIGNFEDGAMASPGRQGRGFGLGDVCDRNLSVEKVGTINFLGAIYIYIYIYNDSLGWRFKTMNLQMNLNPQTQISEIERPMFRSW